MTERYACMQKVHDDWDDEQVATAAELAELLWLRDVTDHGWRPVGQPARTLHESMIGFGYQDENDDWHPTHMNRMWRIEGEVEPA